jgi:branched-subunit amino acid ABC-type transport system permease component
VDDLIGSIIRGFPYGCVYALLAVGLVLTYRATGVFNLALGAQAFVSAAVYYDARARHGWPIVAALLVSVVIVGPLLGLVLNSLLFRHLRGAPPVARLVTSLGLLVAMSEIVKLWFGSGPEPIPTRIPTTPRYCTDATGLDVRSTGQDNTQWDCPDDSQRLPKPCAQFRILPGARLRWSARRGGDAR